MSPRRHKCVSAHQAEPTLFSSLPGLRPKDLDEKKAIKLRALERSARKKRVRKQRAEDRKIEKKQAKRATSQNRQASKIQTKQAYDESLFPFTMVSKVKEWQLRCDPTLVAPTTKDAEENQSDDNERKDSLSPQSTRKQTRRVNEPPVTPNRKPLSFVAGNLTSDSPLTAPQTSNTPVTPTPIPIKYDEVNSSPYPGSKKSEACDCPTINGLCKHSLLPVGGVYHPVTALKAFGPKGKMLESTFQCKTPTFSLNARRKRERPDPPDTLYLVRSSKDQPLSEFHPAKRSADAWMDSLEALNRRGKEAGGDETPQSLVDEQCLPDPDTPSKSAKKSRKRSRAKDGKSKKHSVVSPECPIPEEPIGEKFFEVAVNSLTSSNKSRNRKRKHGEDHRSAKRKKSLLSPLSNQDPDEEDSPSNSKKNKGRTCAQANESKKSAKTSHDHPPCETSNEQNSSPTVASQKEKVTSALVNGQLELMSDNVDDEDNAQTLDAISYILDVINSRPPSNPTTAKKVVFDGDSTVFLCKTQTLCNELRCSPTSSTFQCPVKTYSKEESSTSLLRNDWLPFYKFLCAKRKALNIRSHEHLPPPVLPSPAPGSPFLKRQYAPPATSTFSQASNPQ